MEQPLLNAPYPRGSPEYIQWLARQLGLDPLAPLPSAPIRTPRPPPPPTPRPPPPPPPPPPQAPAPERRSWLGFLSRCAHVAFAWLVVPRDRWLSRLYSALFFTLVVGTVLLAMYTPRYQPEYEATLNPSVAAGIMLDKPPVGFYMPNDTRLSDTLSPRENNLALTASILRSYCANISTIFSPHITREYRDTAQSIRQALEHGYLYADALVKERHMRTLELYVIKEPAVQLRETVHAPRPCFFCRSQDSYSYAFATKNAAIHGWNRRTGTNVTIPAQVTSAASTILDLKHALTKLDRDDMFPVRSNTDNLVYAADKLAHAATRLELVTKAVVSLSRLSAGDVPKDLTRQAGEAIFRTIPWSGAVVKYVASGFWKWVSASEEVAVAFTAGALEGHTLAGLHSIRTAHEQLLAWQRWVGGERAAVDTHGIIEASGAEGQEVARAADLVSMVAGRLLHQRQYELQQVKTRLGATFGLGA
ncbi:hypothetical protein F5Y08DRAFT_350549 [Xylaria arbuscula]|nr:hypothetical protein F5Y08DRAFT_350549 [Xylaria arbuscula]